MSALLDSLFRILALTRKELLAVLKDPRSRVTLFLPPILQSLLFGYAATYDLNHVPYAVFDEDRGAAAHDLIAKLDGSGVFEQVARIYRAGDIADLIDNRRALLVIRIGKDFERRIAADQPADIQVIADGRNSNTAGIALGYVNAIVEAFNADWQTAHGQKGSPIRVTTRAWYNPNLETRWHMIPSLIGTLTLLQTLLLTAMSVAREREQGTFDQLLVTPFRPAEIMAGKALPSLLVGLVQAIDGEKQHVLSKGSVLAVPLPVTRKHAPGQRKRNSSGSDDREGNTSSSVPPARIVSTSWLPIEKITCGGDGAGSRWPARAE